MTGLTTAETAVAASAAAGSAILGEVLGVPLPAVLGSFVGALVVRVLVEKKQPRSVRDFVFVLVVMLTTTLMAAILSYAFGRRLLVWEAVDNAAQSYLVTGLFFGLGAQAIAEQVSQFIIRLTDGVADAVADRILPSKKGKSE